MVALSDAPRLIEIYAPAILHSSASFENEVPSRQDFEARIQEVIQKFPWLVCEIDQKVVGYSYASPHRNRAAYEWSVESAIYVDPRFKRRGVARQLYLRLFDLLREQGVASVLAGITLPNEASQMLHESLGFRLSGTFRNIGFKQGSWWDVGWWQLELQNPVPPRPLAPPKYETTTT